MSYLTRLRSANQSEVVNDNLLILKGRVQFLIIVNTPYILLVDSLYIVCKFTLIEPQNRLCF